MGPYKPIQSPLIRAYETNVKNVRYLKKETVQTTTRLSDE